MKVVHTQPSLRPQGPSRRWSLHLQPGAAALPFEGWDSPVSGPARSISAAYKEHHLMPRFNPRVDYRAFIRCRRKRGRVERFRQRRTKQLLRVLPCQHSKACAQALIINSGNLSRGKSGPVRSQQAFAFSAGPSVFRLAQTRTSAGATSCRRHHLLQFLPQPNV